MAALFVLLLGIYGIPATDGGANVAAHQEQLLHGLPLTLNLSPPALDRSISDVIEQREYSWRMPRDNSRPKRGAVTSFVDAFIGWWSDLFRAIGRWVIKFLEWLWKLLPEPASSEPDEAHSISRWMNTTQALLFALLAVVACAVAILLKRFWLRRSDKSGEASVEVVSPTADSPGDNIVAAQFPGDEWLAMAWGLLERGESRLALRALYLASLAYLSERELITITKFKSDRDYERDLKRRVQAKPDLLSAFAENLSLFQRAWYGKHAVTPEDVGLFTGNIERMKAYAYR